MKKANKKIGVIYFTFLAIAILLLPTVYAAHGICGYVESAADGTDSAWHIVRIYYKANESNYESCEIAPEENKYCCDAETIPKSSWKIGNVIFAKVIDAGDGYYALPVNVTTTGSGYDVEPPMTLASNLMIISPRNITYSNLSVALEIQTLNPYNNTLWYNINGSNITLCSSCNQASSLLNLSYENYALTVYANSSNSTISKQIFFSIEETLNYGERWEEKGYSWIIPGKPVILKPSYPIKITQITIEVKNKVEKVTIAIRKIDKPKISFFGDVHQYIELSESIADKDIERVIVEFKVEKNWLSQNNYNKNDVVLMKYKENGWEKLETSFLEEDSDYFYYESKSKTLSIFAIVAEKAKLAEKKTEEDTKEIKEPEVTEQERKVTEEKVEEEFLQETKEKGILKLIIFIIIALIIFIVFFIIRKRKGIKNQLKQFKFSKLFKCVKT